MSQLKKGAILNYTTIILTNVVGLLLTPFIIRQLGDSEFGLYTMIGSFVGYIAVLDFGLSDAVVRFVAKYRAEKDKKGEENFLANTMLIYLVISTLVVLVGTVFYLNMDSVFQNSLTANELVQAKIMFAILVFNLAISLPAGSFTGICFGYEQFAFPKSAKIIRYISRSVLVVALLLLGGKAIAMVILDTVLNIVLDAVLIWYVFKKLKVRIKLHQYNFKLVKNIFSYSLWIFVFVIVSQFQWKVGQMVLGVVANTTVVAVFAVGVMLGTYYGAFSTAISEVFLPRATQMTVANATPEELTDMMIRIGRISFITLMLVLGGFVLYGSQFVSLWVGDNYHDAWIIASLIMLAYTVPLVQGFANSILQAKNKLAFKALSYLLFLILGTAFGAFLAKDYGGVGMIVGTVTGWVIVQNIMNVYYYKVIKLNIIRFFRELLNKTLFVFILTLAIGYAINLIPGHGWLNLIAKIVLYVGVYIVLMYKFGIVENEKELFRASLFPILKRIKA